MYIMNLNQKEIEKELYSKQLYYSENDYISHILKQVNGEEFLSLRILEKKNVKKTESPLQEIEKQTLKIVENYLGCEDLKQEFKEYVRSKIFLDPTLQEQVHSLPDKFLRLIDEDEIPCLFVTRSPIDKSLIDVSVSLSSRGSHKKIRIRFGKSGLAYEF